MDVKMDINNNDSLYFINNKLLFNKEFILNNSELNTILDDQTKKYTLDNLKNVFYKFDEAIILVQIIDGNIKFIEKKGYEGRNQSVIDLLIKANIYNNLPNVQFLVFTNDYIKTPLLTQYPFVLTFCKNYKYNTELFPNFNFNNWNEAKIGNYENVYTNLIDQQSGWNNKKDMVFWSGSNTNTIRKKIYDGTKNNKNFLINLIDKNIKSTYYPIEEHIKYKYLLNLNGHSYGGRLNYLFLTGSCVIILKNQDKDKIWNEFFYKYFIPNEDYIEILYNDNERIELILNRISIAINKNNCEEIGQRSFEKAKQIFQINNIYEYIYDTTLNLSKNNIIDTYLENTILYTPPNNYYDRLKLINNNTTFYFKGNDIELIMSDHVQNNIIVKIINNTTNIYLNKVLILNKYTPLIITDTKYQLYNLNITENQLNIIIDNKFNLIKVPLPELEKQLAMPSLIDLSFNISEIKIKTDFGGWWMV